MPPAEEALYNSLARYEYWVEKYGPRKACIILATQSFGAVLSYWTDWLLCCVKLLKLLRRS
jgi:hypothetical protein